MSWTRNIRQWNEFKLIEALVHIAKDRNKFEIFFQTTSTMKICSIKIDFFGYTRI